MNNQNNIDDALLAKHFDGETTKKENAIIKQWIGLSIENDQNYKEFKKIWIQSQGISVNNELHFDKKKAFDKVLNRIKTDTKPKNKIVKWSTYIARIAAVFILGVSFYLIYQYFKPNSLDNQDLITETNLQQEYVKVDSSYILLPDKSSIYLNSNGIAEYAKNFIENRTVRMRGEAFFDVVKSEEKPFIVNTNDIEVTVVGTSFFISPQSNDSIIEVGVTKGIVVVKQKFNTKTVQLKANESIRVNVKSRTFYEIESVDLNVLFWKTGELEFNELPLNQVLQILSKVYKTEITFVTEDVMDCIYTGRFANASLVEILNQITYNFNIIYSQDTRNNIIVKGKGCK